MRINTKWIALLSFAVIGILSFTLLYAGSTSSDEPAQADGTEQVTDTPAKKHCSFSKGEATEKDWSKCSSKKKAYTAEECAEKKAKCGTMTDAEKAECKKKCDTEAKAEATEETGTYELN